MNRRQLFAAAPAVAVFGVSAPSVSPVAVIYGEWRAHHRFMSTVDLSDDQFDQAAAVLSEIEQRLFAEPAQSARDTCLKLIALTGGGSDFTDDAKNHGAKIAREAVLWAGDATGRAA